MRLSTPPSDSASLKIFVLATNAVGFFLRLGQKRDHAAEVVHLFRGDRVAGMLREPRIEGLLDAWMPFEKARQRMSALTMLAHAHSERLDSPQHEPAVHRARDGSQGLLEEQKPLCDRRIVRRGETADDVRVSTEVLGRRVHHDVRAELQRPLQIGRRKGVVDDEERAGRMRCVRRLLDVDDVQQRIRRRLDPDDPSALVEMGAQVVELGRGEVVEDVTLGLVDLRGHPVDAAVDIRDQHHPVARAEQVHDRGRRRRAPTRMRLHARRIRARRGIAAVPCASDSRRGSSRSPCARRPPS